MDTQSQFETIHDGDLGAPVLDVVQEAVDAAAITYARTSGTDVEQTPRAELRSRGVRALGGHGARARRPDPRR